MTRRGPTQRTMERLFSEAPKVTDWISCTTPPVRDGEYEFRIKEGQRLFDGNAKRALCIDGKWFSLTDGFYLYTINDSFTGCYEWRGVRRWVLVQEHGTAYVAKHKRQYGWTPDLRYAHAFTTERSAKRFAARSHKHIHKHITLKAVLP